MRSTKKVKKIKLRAKFSTEYHAPKTTPPIWLAHLTFIENKVDEITDINCHHTWLVTKKDAHIRDRGLLTLPFTLSIVICSFVKPKHVWVSKSQYLC